MIGLYTLCCLSVCDRSVACGSLEHSPTVCIFELPPEGPARVDLLTMSVVGQHVAVLPVLNGMGMRHDVAEERHQLVKRMLKSPGVYIENLGSIEMFRCVTPYKSL